MGHTPLREPRWGAHLPVYAVSPQVDKPLTSVTHGQCDARPTVTFPAAGHHRHLTGTKLYCSVTEAHVCEQLAQGCCLKQRPGVEPATFCVASQHPNHYTTRTHVHNRYLYNRIRNNTMKSFIMHTLSAGGPSLRGNDGEAHV